MTNHQLLAAHAYSAEDRTELEMAIALFQVHGLPFNPKGAYELVRGSGQFPVFASWYKSWPLPIGFRVFEVTPVDRAGRYQNAIQQRSMAFDCGNPKGPLLRLPYNRVCWWVVRLSDYYRLLEVQHEQPELALLTEAAKVAS